MKVQPGRKMFLRTPDGWKTEVNVVKVKQPAIGRCVLVADALGRESWVRKGRLEPAPEWVR